MNSFGDPKIVLVESLDTTDAFYLLGPSSRPGGRGNHWICPLVYCLPVLLPLFGSAEGASLVTCEMAARGRGTLIGVPERSDLGDGRYCFDSLWPIVYLLPQSPSIHNLFCYRFMEGFSISCVATHPGHDPVLIHCCGSAAREFVVTTAAKAGVKVQGSVNLRDLLKRSST